DVGGRRGDPGFDGRGIEQRSTRCEDVGTWLQRNRSNRHLHLVRDDGGTAVRIGGVRRDGGTAGWRQRERRDLRRRNLRRRDLRRRDLGARDLRRRNPERRDLRR